MDSTSLDAAILESVNTISRLPNIQSLHWDIPWPQAYTKQKLPWLSSLKLEFQNTGCHIFDLISRYAPIPGLARLSIHGVSDWSSWILQPHLYPYLQLSGVSNVTYLTLCDGGPPTETLYHVMRWFAGL